MPLSFYTYSSRNRYLFSFSLLFICGAIWYIIFFKPINAHIYETESEVEQLAKYYESCVIVDKRDNKQQQYSYYADLCKNKTIELYGTWVHERLLWIIDCLKENQVFLINCKPLSVQLQKPNKDIYFIFFTQANITSINRFFSAVSQSPYILECLRCDIKKINDTILSCKFLMKFSFLSSYKRVEI